MFPQPCKEDIPIKISSGKFINILNSLSIVQFKFVTKDPKCKKILKKVLKYKRAYSWAVISVFSFKCTHMVVVSLFTIQKF